MESVQFGLGQNIVTGWLQCWLVYSWTCFMTWKLLSDKLCSRIHCICTCTCLEPCLITSLCSWSLCLGGSLTVLADWCTLAFALALAWSLVFCSSCLRGPLAVFCWLVYSCAGNCCTCLETCLRNRVLDCNICMKLLHWLGAWFPRSLCSRTNCIWLLALALRLVWVVRRH